MMKTTISGVLSSVDHEKQTITTHFDNVTPTVLAELLQASLSHVRADVTITTTRRHGD